MAITIIPDLVAPHEYEEDDRGGMLARGFRVDGLTSGSDITQKALEAQDNGIYIPAAGQPHPTMADLVVRRVNIRPVTGSTTAMRLVIYYAKVRRRLLDVVLNGVSVNTLTERDATGALMLIGYNGGSGRSGRDSADPGHGVPAATDEEQQLRLLLVRDHAPQVPNQTLEITYLENESPIEKIGQYQGRLNSPPWQGGKPREWFCESITGRIESPIPRNLADLRDQRVVTGQALFDWITTYRFRKRQVAAGWFGLGPTGRLHQPADRHQSQRHRPQAGGYIKKGPGSRGNGWLVSEDFRHRNRLQRTQTGGGHRCPALNPMTPGNAPLRRYISGNAVYLSEITAEHLNQTVDELDRLRHDVAQNRQPLTVVI
jgi:hypothetical protein